MAKRVLIACVALFAAAPAPAPAVAEEDALPFLHVETGLRYAQLADAVAQIGEQGTIRIVPGRYHQCAVHNGGALRLEAEQAGRAVLDGTLCEGRAALVLRGKRTEIDGIIFQNMRSEDGGGAGIRLERGALTVRNAMFNNSNIGISAGADPAATIRIDRSTFSGLGPCTATQGCGAAIDASFYGTVIVTRSLFEKGQGGHYLRSRAMRIEISGSRFDDSDGKNMRHMIELPVGATGEIRSNAFVRGRGTREAEALIAIATLSRDNISDGLFITDNRAGFASGAPQISTFVRDHSGERVTVAGNALESGILSRELR